MTIPDWLPLDNAAKIFPAVYNRERTSVFRLTAEIDRPVRYSTLLKALKIAQERVPYFTVQLRRGFFWYWLDYESPGIPVMADLQPPCRSFRFSNRQQPQVRVLVRDNQISCEFFHALTDGSGGMIFLRILIAAYAKTAGIPLPESEAGLLNSTCGQEETEDAYNRYFDPNLPAPPQIKKAYHLPFPKRQKPRYQVLPIEIPATLVKKKAKEHKLTVTEYLVSVYFWAMQEAYHQFPNRGYLKRRSVIRIQIPVNLRNFFQSKTLRNFAIFVVPEIDMRLGHYSFDEICRVVHHRVQLETDPKLLKRVIYRNVRNEKSFFIRIIPLVIKNKVLSFFFFRSGISIYSGLITNLGRIEFTGEFGNFVRRMRFYPPPPDHTKIAIGMITLNQKMVITFGSITDSKALEKLFTGFLKREGIPVKLINP